MYTLAMTGQEVRPWEASLSGVWGLLAEPAGCSSCILTSGRPEGPGTTSFRDRDSQTWQEDCQSQVTVDDPSDGDRED